MARPQTPQSYHETQYDEFHNHMAAAARRPVPPYQCRQLDAFL